MLALNTDPDPPRKHSITVLHYSCTDYILGLRRSLSLISFTPGVSQQMFSGKGQIVNVCSVGHMDSVPSPKPCCWGMKAARECIYTNRCVSVIEMSLIDTELWISHNLHKSWNNHSPFFVLTFENIKTIHSPKQAVNWIWPTDWPLLCSSLLLFLHVIKGMARFLNFSVFICLFSGSLWIVTISFNSFLPSSVPPSHSLLSPCPPFSLLFSPPFPGILWGCAVIHISKVWCRKQAQDLSSKTLAQDQWFPPNSKLVLRLFTLSPSNRLLFSFLLWPPVSPPLAIQTPLDTDIQRGLGIPALLYGGKSICIPPPPPDWTLLLVLEC